MNVSLRRLGLAALTLIVLTLTACAGGAAPATSWPGATLAGDIAYVAFNQHVYAVDLQAQTKRWQWNETVTQNNDDTYYGVPAMAGDRLIVGGYNQGRVYAINPADGSTVWAFTPEWGDVIPGLSLLKYPNGNFVAGAGIGADGSAYIGTNNGYLYALDTRTTDESKRLRWSFRTEDRNGFWSQPVVADGTIYATSLGHQLYALDAASGSARDTVFTTNAPMAGDVNVTGTLAIMGTFGNRVLAVDTSSQQLRWEREVDDWVWGVPQIFSNTVYAATLSGTVYALNVSDGAVLWSRQLSDNPAVRAPLLVTQKAIFVAGRDGKLYALDRNGGKNLFEPITVGQNAQLLSQPLLWAPDKVVVTPMGTDTLLQVYNADTGSLVFTFKP